MGTNNLCIFGVTVRGNHPDFVFKRYFGLAESIESAMEIAHTAALVDGWSNVELDDVLKYGSIDFCPEFFKKESEVEKCQP
jgi:hypothetical protein